MYRVTKREGNLESFDISRIESAIRKAFMSCETEVSEDVIKNIAKAVNIWDTISIEDIQDQIIELLGDYDYPDVAAAYRSYKDKQSRARMLWRKIHYMDEYIDSNENAATMSNTDGNANTSAKNVATLEPEVFKDDFRTIQRYRMKRKLKQMYPEVAYDYERDIEGHEIYVHDEASTPTLKQYCMAVSLYPLMLEGCGVLDKTTPSEPNDLQSFSGQLVNSIFTLSAQCKGAVAVGSYFIALNYYIVAEYGEKWYEHLDDVVTSSNCKKSRTMRNMIEKAFKQFVCGINQPAGNRGYQSPFTNISYYDHTYFSSLFGTFYYPDGTQPEWEAVDALQRLFMNWFNQWRLRQLVAFPVETMAMVYDPKTGDIIDKDYKDLTAEMYAKGHSFFTYISDSADSLASCCRLRNELAENTFSPTSGMTGIKTGSANVITLNVNRIIQNYFGPYKHEEVVKKELWNDSVHRSEFVRYLTSILERVYKYHIAYKTMLYEWESKGAYASSNGGFINIKDLYSTIGINGLNEAARFLGLEVSNNPEYIQFLQLVLGTIKEQNKKHSIHDKKRPFLFNSECVPAESLGGKNYRWDKSDGYWVPEDENLYNSYFYNAHDNTSVLDKFILHGRQTSSYCDGGSALHCNLQDHLSKEQYLKLIDFAVSQGTNYFTFNIPNSQCDDCHFITKRPIKVCPKCGSSHITQYTRIIGYLRPITAFGSDRKIEAGERTYSTL
ncbi:anaerobic ribonucleoside-triphosphate reductase [Catenibacterium sp.]|uniref:anaerobic ribonucleoside-triphosphate reductase n=1 Tax=Catenibacterium sp. TaxID=2049022 RepID=UPI002E75A667|nr:anaerobic ribonucleoside-triphosphate reductase [Catenibacterium sp.]MEE0040869.1 anaerobic ribonucleoside-triphosphate reductase [Catenibacterium sp.]